MRPVTVTLVVGLVLLAIGIALVLARAPLAVAGSNSVTARDYVEVAAGNVGGCQPVRVVPAGTSSLRISIEARAVGPAVSVKLFSGARLVSRGREPAGWGTAPTATVPIAPLAHALPGALVCVQLGPAVEPVRVYGAQLPGPATGLSAGTLQRLAPRIEYLRGSQRSWWSRLGSIIQRMGLGRAGSGDWIAIFALIVMLATSALASWLILRELP